MLKKLAGNKKALLFLVLFLQISILAGMVLDSYRIIASGEKVLLKIEPADPRSLFQGDYVILRYPFNDLDLGKVAHDLDLARTYNQQNVYLLLEQKGEIWEPVFVTQDSNKLKGKTYLKAKVIFLSQGAPSTLLHLKFDINTFFVPEGKGQVIEKQIQEGALYAQVSVYKGKARVTGLVSK